MASKPTVASVHTDLKSHEKMCEERWKTIFNETADLKHEIRSVNLQLKAGLDANIAEKITPTSVTKTIG